MALTSKNGHVKKICGCATWKTCSHPWYISYREGIEVNPKTGKLREPGLRCKLANLVGREPVDFADAKAEARRAIVAWKDGLDARRLLPGDAPTVAALLDGYSERPGGSPNNYYQRGWIAKTVVNGRPFGDWRAADVTREMIEAFQRQRPAVSGNRDLALLRAAFNWAVLGGLVASTPFKVGTVSAIRLRREEPRTRRLYAGEQERLLLNAGGLHDLIVAALETGCRRGELLSLQWSQVGADLFFPAGKTKTKKPRRVPISSVLRAVLDARRVDPAGDPLPADAFVFGDAIGRRRGLFQTAWRLTLKRAKVEGLHFHDLRREAGSRWLEGGVPLSTIQKWLGYHNISQTSTYLAATHGGDVDAMRAFEERLGRLPNVAESANATSDQQAPTDTPTSENTPKSVVVH